MKGTEKIAVEATFWVGCNDNVVGGIERSFTSKDVGFQPEK